MGCITPVKLLGSEWDIDPTECKFCYLVRINKLAQDNHKVITTNRTRGKLHRRRKGFDIRLNGIRICWISEFPQHCKCEASP